MQTAIEEFTLDLPTGVQLACRAAGPRGAPTVVLLHGFPEAAFVWDEVMQQMGGQARCVAPNLRGYAGSSAPAEVEAYRAKHLVADIAALIDKLGAPIDVLVAHDWGGALAWNLAAQRPELLRQLLIVNSPHPATFLRELRENPAQQQASAYMRFLCRPDAEQLLSENGFARLWPFLIGRGAPWLTEPVRERYRQVWAQGLTGPLNYYRASPLRPPADAADAVHQLQLPAEAVTSRVPTALLWGDADVALLPGLLQGIEQWVPQLEEVERVADASHWIVHEQPERVAAALGRALARARVAA